MLVKGMEELGFPLSQGKSKVLLVEPDGFREEALAKLRPWCIQRDIDYEGRGR